MMINIKYYLKENKRRICRHKEFRPLFKQNLSEKEVTELSHNIFNKFEQGRSSMYTDLFSYTHQILSNSLTEVIALSLQCTDSNVYMQFECGINSITLSKDTIVYYLDNDLYLASNRIITATGIAENGTISWSNKIVFDNDCYMDLPFPTTLPDDSKILPTLILNNLQLVNKRSQTIHQR
jgi:hypothetical protein